jgi:hypothetical protein
MQTRRNAFGHEAMVSRMEFDDIDAITPGIERAQLRWVVVGKPRLFEHFGRSPTPAKFRQRHGSSTPLAAMASCKAQLLSNKSTFS